MTRAALRTGAGLALAAALALAGCTSSNAGPDSGSPAPSAPSSADLTAITPIPGSDTSTPETSSPARSSTPAPSTTATSTLPPKPTPTGPLGCTSTQLKVRALRGSAAAGQEFALITFTNTSPVACTLVGFPGVSLRLHNALLGKPAERSAKTPTTVLLKPGQQAESALRDYSSCAAAVSDTVRVYAPNQRPFIDLPLALRGCRVVVDPVAPS